MVYRWEALNALLALLLLGLAVRSLAWIVNGDLGHAPSATMREI